MPPGLRVKGTAAFEAKEYPALLMDQELIVTGPVPEAVNVVESDFELPIATLPKLRLEALAVSCCVPLLVPVPLNGSESVLDVVELLLIEREPLADPTPVG